MQTSPDAMVMLGVFTPGGGEVVVVLAIVVMLFTNSLPRMLRWLLGDDAHDAGRGLGGILGKRGAQAITPDNKVAELYDPGAFRKRPQRRNRFKNALLKLWRWIRGGMGWR